MFKALGWLIKISIFTVAILVLGNMVHWKGQTVSDQVKTSLAHAQNSGALTDTVQDVKTWANHIISDQKKVPPRNHAKRITAPNKAAPVEKVSASMGSEEIPSTERQKLRDLIQELNTARTAQASK